MNERFGLNYDEDLCRLKRDYGREIPVITDGGVRCTQEYVCSRANELEREKATLKEIINNKMAFEDKVLDVLLSMNERDLSPVERAFFNILLKEMEIDLKNFGCKVIEDE